MVDCLFSETSYSDESAHMTGLLSSHIDPRCPCIDMLLSQWRKNKGRMSTASPTYRLGRSQPSRSSLRPNEQHMRSAMALMIDSTNLLRRANDDVGEMLIDKE